MENIEKWKKNSTGTWLECEKKKYNASSAYNNEIFVDSLQVSMYGLYAQIIKYFL
jgi:hypothetical protein